MSKYIFLDKVCSIPINRKINYIEIDENSKFEIKEELNFNSSETKVHEIIKNEKCKKKIITSIILLDKDEIKEIFFKFKSIAIKIKILNYLDYLQNDSKNKLDYFSYILNKHKNNLMILRYQIEYIKGSNGKKHLVPIYSYIDKYISCNNIIKLSEYYIDNQIKFKKSLEYLVNYKKKYKNLIILKFIFNNKKKNYFSFLDYYLKCEICKYL